MVWWCNGAVVQWCSGAVVQWCGGVVMWCNCAYDMFLPKHTNVGWFIAYLVTLLIIF
jgi:hypothetical protein